MHRILIRSPGGHSALELVEEPDLEPGEGRVRVAVEAIGVSYADCLVRMGLYSSAKRYVGWPITPGFEFSGTVDARGPGCEDFELGSSVIGVTRFGAYATQVCVDPQLLFPLPEAFDFAAGAGLPTNYLTAWYALHELCHVRPGLRVLVHSAAGGVGSALVQLAKLSDCHVVGVVGSTHKVDVARGQGCDVVVDGSGDHLWEEAAAASPQGFDIVLDANGPSTLSESYEHLAPQGRLVVYGFSSLVPRNAPSPRRLRLLLNHYRTPRFDPYDMLEKNRSVLAFNLSYLFHRTDLLRAAMSRVLSLAEEGRIRPDPLTTYPLEAAATAHRDIESGRTVGKLVLVTDPAQSSSSTG